MPKASPGLYLCLQFFPFDEQVREREHRAAVADDQPARDLAAHVLERASRGPRDRGLWAAPKSQQCASAAGPLLLLSLLSLASSVIT